MSSLEIQIKDNILQFYKEIETDQYHRYRSWEHSYLFFQNVRRSSQISLEIIDNATLNLAFYLASWGMYRGSSELLQKDYKVHTRIVQEIFNARYSQLWHIDFDTINVDAPEINLILQLAERLRQIYVELLVSPTDTLVTKVILGTLGCTPAYDTYFISGVTEWNKKYKPKFPARFGINSLRGLIGFYCEHMQNFKEAQKYIAQHGVIYPVMKLADMFFWSIRQ